MVFLGGCNFNYLTVLKKKTSRKRWFQRKTIKNFYAKMEVRQFLALLTFFKRQVICIFPWRFKNNYYLLNSWRFLNIKWYVLRSSFCMFFSISIGWPPHKREYYSHRWWPITRFDRSLKGTRFDVSALWGKNVSALFFSLFLYQMCFEPLKWKTISISTLNDNPWLMATHNWRLESLVSHKHFHY